MRYIFFVVGLFLFSSLFVNKPIYNGNELIIPKIELSTKITSSLEDGIVMSSKSTFNNMVLFGHSGNHDRAYFKRLKNLDIGNAIYFRGERYIVSKSKVIAANDFSIFDYEGKKRLVLVTCVLFNRSKRLIVIAYKK